MTDLPKHFADMLGDAGFREGYPWSPQHIDDLRSVSYRYESFALWSPRPMESPTICIGTDGRRRTWTAPDAADAPRVLVYGGSTAFGVCADDDETIASHVARGLDRDGVRARVMNCGVEGHNLYQGFVALTKSLRAGERPAVAVFYNGINDLSTGVVDPGQPNDHVNFIRTKFLFEGGQASPAWQTVVHVQKKLPGIAFTYDADTGQVVPLRFDADSVIARCRETFAVYRETRRMIHAVCEAYGIAAVFAWQPCLLYGDKPASAFEAHVRDVIDVYFDFAPRREGLRLGAETLWAMAEADEAPGYRFLGHVLDDLDEHAYWDWGHLGPPGNAVVGRHIAGIVRPCLETVGEPRRVV